MTRQLRRSHVRRLTKVLVGLGVTIGLTTGALAQQSLPQVTSAANLAKLIVGQYPAGYVHRSDIGADFHFSGTNCGSPGTFQVQPAAGTGCWVGVAAQLNAPIITGGLTESGTAQFSGSVAIVGAALSMSGNVGQQVIYVSNANNFSTSAVVNPSVYFNITDTATDTNLGGAIQSLLVNNTVVGTVGQGNRTGITSLLNMNAPTGGAWNSQTNFSSAIFGQTYVNANDKGSSVVYTGGVTTSGSNDITGLSGTANCAANQPVTGSGIPAGDWVLVVDSGSRIHIYPYPATATASGVSVTCGRYVQDYYAIAGLTEVNSAAAGLFNSTNGAEFDTSVQAGNKLNLKFGVKSAQTNSDAVQGGLQDAAFVVERDTTSTAPWICAYCVGSMEGLWPVDAVAGHKGTILGILLSGSTMAADFGIDLVGQKAATSGAPLGLFKINSVGNAIQTPDNVGGVGFSVDYIGNTREANTFPIYELYNTSGAIAGGAKARLYNDGTYTGLMINTDAGGGYATSTVPFRSLADGILDVPYGLLPTGGVKAAGGFSASPRNFSTCGVGGNGDVAGFTNQTPTGGGGAGASDAYIAEIWIPANVTLTGLAPYNGTVASGNLKVGLFNSTGTKVASSASTAMSGTAVYQRIAFTAPYAALGPATYYAGLMFDNATARFYTHAVGACGTQDQPSQTFATGFTNITAPTTFTNNAGPLISAY